MEFIKNNIWYIAGGILLLLIILTPNNISNEIKGQQKPQVGFVVKNDYESGGRYYIEYEYITGLIEHSNFDDTPAGTKPGLNIVSQELIKMPYDNIIILSGLNVIFEKKYQYHSPDQKLQAEQEKKIKMHFSQLDGEHRVLSSYIKQSMHSPDSFEFIRETHIVSGGYLIVDYYYKGKNLIDTTGFGYVKAKINIQDPLDITILEEK